MEPDKKLVEAFSMAVSKGAFSELPKEEKKEIKCRWCGRPLDTKQKLNNHIKKEHPDKWKKR